MNRWLLYHRLSHYDDVIMTMLTSQITSLTVVYSIVYSGVNQRKHQSSASLAFVREIHRGPVNFPHKWPVTRKMFPFDDVIMVNGVRHPNDHFLNNYRQISNIIRTKSQNLNVPRLVLLLPNPLKPGVKSGMKMNLEQRRQAMLQLHLGDQQLWCLLRCVLYQRFDGKSFLIESL